MMPVRVGSLMRLMRRLVLRALRARAGSTLTTRSGKILVG